MLIAELISSFFFGDVSFILFLHGRKFRKNAYLGIYSENGEQTIEKRFQTMLSTKANRKEQKFIDLNEMTKMTDCIYPKLSIDSHWLPTPVSTVS